MLQQIFPDDVCFGVECDAILYTGVRPEEIIQQEKTDDSEENEEETGTLETGTTGEIETGTTGTFSNGTTGTSENGTTGTQGTEGEIKEEKAPNTTFDNDDSLDLDSEEYDLDGF